MNGSPQMVAAGRLLSDLSAQLCRRQRRRHRRLPGDDRQAGLPARPRRRCDLAVAALSVAIPRLRLRHLRLHGRRPRVRLARRLHSAFSRGARPRHARRARSRAQPHVRSASLVSQVALEPRQPETRLVRLARRQGRRPSQQLGLDLRRLGWELDPTTGQYYYHVFLKEQPDLNWRNPRSRGHVGRGALLARPGRGRFPARRHRHDLRAPRLPDHTAKCRRPYRCRGRYRQTDDDHERPDDYQQLMRFQSSSRASTN